MRILLAEYTVFHDESLADEGRAMLNTLTDSFERCGHRVISPEHGDFSEEIARLAKGCDAGLVIAPDHLLSKYTWILESRTWNLGCGSLNAAVCADKVKTGEILAAHGIPVPEMRSRGRRVIKPIMGCGAQDVRLAEDDGAAEGEFGQEFIEGEHLSVSLIGTHVVGETCLYHTGLPPLLLAVNRQEISIQDGRFEYLGGETPVYPERYEEVVSTAKRAVTLLGCQGYVGVDIVLADRAYVVDVNPRITTSVVGIARVMKEELADLIINASHGSVPASVHLSGHVRFFKDGRIVHA